MNALNSVRPAEALAVTSSDLVRHFGLWQDRAQQAPVYVHHRGRPRLVLASVELMSRLCAPHLDGSGADRARIDALLDVIDTLIVVVDREGSIAAIGRRAARFFDVDVGSRAASLAGAGTEALLDAAIRRVLASGHDEALDIAGPHAGRRLAVELVASGDGLVLIARDATVADDLAEVRAICDATDEALDAAGGVAIATIGLRGYLEGPASLMAKITGVSADALASVRFVTLFDTGSRVPLGEAIEAVIAEARRKTVAARLLVNRGGALDITAGLAPIRRRGVTVAVRVAIVAPRLSRDPTSANGA